MKPLLFSLCFISLTFCEKLPQKVVICGTCKNVAPALPYTINIMEKIGNLFADYRIVVYENNSTDKTPQILKNWSKKNSKILAISEQLTQEECKRIFVNIDHAGKNNGTFFKPEPIARARNIVQNIAMSEQYAPFEFLIWMDMDFKIEPSYEGFIDTFRSNKEWDAVFAYGLHFDGRYYDWYALRDAKYPLGSELLGSYWWSTQKKLTLDLKSDWYPVYSAFGGCGIYRKSSVKGCEYIALVTKNLEDFYKKVLSAVPKQHPFVQKYLNEIHSLKQTIKVAYPPHYNLPELRNPDIGIVIETFSEDIIWRMSTFTYKYPSVCEHVTLHASMAVNGHDKLFINPKLLFRYSD